MFNLVEKNKKLIQVFLGLIAITFVTWGMESFTRGGGVDTVASVNGLDIGRREFDEQYRVQQEQIRRMFGATVDPATFDSPEVRSALLESLVSQRLLVSEVVRSRLLMSREAVIDAITKAPEFQEKGQFSPALYSAFLAQRNTTDQRNVAELQTQLPLQRLSSAITETALPSRTVQARIAALESQQREIFESRLAGQGFEARVKIDAGKVKAHYNANPSDYQTPERVKAQYVVLSAEALSRDDPPTDAEIKAAYDARAAEYTVPEQRRARHILVKTRGEAAKLLAEVKATPARFAELAKQHSEDTVSATNGGDLGVVSKDSLASTKLADAVLAMQQGEFQVIESEFGFHLVQITSLRPGKSRALDEVRKELAAELARGKGAKKFAAAAETFTNLVYEQSDSLTPVVERFKLQLQTTGWVGKAAGQELGALDNPKLLLALFSQDVLRNKRNTDAVEVAPNTLVAARVLEHQPAAQRKLEEVQDEIAQLLRRREGAALAHQDGAAKLEALRKGDDSSVNWGPPRLVSRRAAQGLPADVLRQVVAADVSKLPAYVGIPVPESGYVLLRISRVVEADPKAEDPRNTARLENAVATAQFEAYVKSLRARADVSVRKISLETK